MQCDFLCSDCEVFRRSGHGAAACAFPSADRPTGSEYSAMTVTRLSRCFAPLASCGSAPMQRIRCKACIRRMYMLQRAVYIQRAICSAECFTGALAAEAESQDRVQARVLERPIFGTNCTASHPTAPPCTTQVSCAVRAALCCAVPCSLAAVV